ncbi:phosphoesterase PA-phosphatase related protein [Ferrimonas balearica DSM 9799]|uniref:undecaprenyl-diphosphate phosphatase n=1 Tax=Ferrimonas balearica (strain DSM 9799 / CCM 4581 / KCTC 23876 / PAT) TaxID=550540 RepID=E1STD7_FERBD|nr:phosphatase PAP2 family protein [Ferrimonas balearica]MBY6017673.1 phosphatase PAP2 family protein [Halomonas denitrificans]ADN77171.1 phosphoesterase PA-phosphatase related protein [Ferrimonas balearica DSM 9799]MBW3139835.1 phosphatase PAP2 family protein [Ferrimonas balearica]MBW3164857.1 phosphatase PAP2 family protein [Ferrimonas balearica]MBY5980276.1 phosphatase PAP2 family protein [Ferrimonas balearica]
MWFKRLLPLLLLLASPAKADSEQLASALRIALPAAAAGTALWKEDYDGLWQFGLSFAASSATTLVLKSAVDADRPDGSDNDSFPSGHATNAFSAAAYLQRRYGWQYGAPAYALASWTAVSRVNTNDHNWADVLAGAAIGIAFNQWLVDPQAPVQLAPVVLDDGLMISGIVTF